MGKYLYFLLKLSILKTIRFNFKYFGIKSVFSPKVLISKNVLLKKLQGRISIDKNSKKCHIGFSKNYIYESYKGKTLFYNEGLVILRGNLCISQGCSIVVMKNGCLDFGNDVHISQKTQIECHKKITISDNCVISWDCLLIDSDTHPIYDLNGVLINQNKEIYLGRGSWVCCRCIVLKGAYLSDYSILGAGQILSKRILDENVIVANNSVKKKGFIIRMEDDSL